MFAVSFFIIKKKYSKKKISLFVIKIREIFQLKVSRGEMRNVFFLGVRATARVRRRATGSPGIDPASRLCFELPDVSFDVCCTQYYRDL